MGQALYRKYRSKALSEIVGQEHITTTLERSINDGTLAHAYLFTGPRGSGKTSIARILAHLINGIEYVDESMHLDIIEIDAASNRRIDEIRELRDKVNIAPTSARYKVYIIDEVHMLTKEAFNALLKTLEEPPAHVVFILATTELHKVPDTIVSRTQRFAFKPVEADKVVAHLRFIADTENIDIDDEALLLIAEHGGGSFRDSISLLDQMRNSPQKPITADAVRLLLGVPEASAIKALLQTIRLADQAKVLETLKELLEQGFGAPQIAGQLYDLAKYELLNGADDSESLLTLMQQLLGVSAAHNPELKLELVALQASTPTTPKPATVATPPSHTTSSAALSEAVRQAATPAPTPPPTIDTPTATPPEKPNVVDQAPQSTDPPEVTTPASAEATESSETDETSRSAESAEVPTGSAPLDNGLWHRVLIEAKSHNNTLYGVLRMAHPTFEGTTVTLAFAFVFHQKRLNEAKNKSFVADCIYKLSGQNVTITVVVDKNLHGDPPDLQAPPAHAAPPPITPPAVTAANSNAPASPAGMAEAPKGDTVKSVMDVFGGGEIL